MANSYCTVKYQTKVNAFIIRGFFITMICVLGLLYFVVTMYLASKGQEINDLAKEKESLVKINGNIMFSISENESVIRVADKMKGLSLVEVESFDYIEVPSDAVLVQR